MFTTLAHSCGDVAIQHSFTAVRYSDSPSSLIVFNSFLEMIQTPPWNIDLLTWVWTFSTFMEPTWSTNYVLIMALNYIVAQCALHSYSKLPDYHYPAASVYYPTSFIECTLGHKELIMPPSSSRNCIHFLAMLLLTDYPPVLNSSSQPLYQRCMRAPPEWKIIFSCHTIPRFRDISFQGKTC